jgi:hypothetical protein
MSRSNGHPYQNMFQSPGGGKRIADPIPLTISFPGFFAAGSSAGNVRAIDDYTVQVTLSPPLQLPDEFEMHLVNGTVSYTQPNIGAAAAGITGFPAGNNRISIQFDTNPRTDYLLPQGLYTFFDVADALNVIAFNNGWISSLDTPMFILEGIEATQQIIFKVSPAGLAGGVFPTGPGATGPVIDFLNPGALGLNDSIGPILGFPTSGAGATITLQAAGTTTETFFAPNIANFALHSAYVAFLSCLRDSSFQGATGKILYVFPLAAGAPNSVLQFQPPLANPIPVVAGTYSQITVSFTDQSGNRLRLDNFQAATVLSIIGGKTKFDGSI